MAIANLQPANDKRAARVLWLIFVILAAGIALSGIFVYQNKENQFIKEMEHKLAAIADLKAGEILRWKTERLRDAEVFFRNPVFAGLVRDFFAHPQASMRERSELSGGTFSIESSPGHGTVVQVTWPEKTGAGEEPV